MRTHRWLALAIGVLAPATAGTASAGEPVHAHDQARERAPLFDVRQGSAGVAPAVVRARAAFVRELGPQAFLSVDRVTGAVRFLGRTDGFLSAPLRGTPEQVALRWTREHRDVLGLRARDLRGFHLVNRYRAPGGVTRLIFQQRFHGIPAFDNSLRVNVTSDGRVLNVGGSPRSRLRVDSLVPRLDPASAVAAAARGVHAPSTPRLQRLAGPRGVRLETTFAGRHSARLSLLSMGPHEVRLVWRVWFEESSTAAWDVLVDAGSGRMLRRVNHVKWATGLAWDFYPGAKAGGTPREVDFSQWKTEAGRLRGNNTHTYNDADNTEDWYNDGVDPTQESMGDIVSPNEEIRPDGVTSGNWKYQYTPIPSPAGYCPKAGCAWNHLVNGSWVPNRDQDGTQVYFFVNRFHDHLLAPPISFTEAAGNFQFENTTGQGKGNDGIYASAMDAAGVVVGRPVPVLNSDNANMLTRPDGLAPRMQMYLFEPLPFAPALDYPFSDVSGGSDGTIVYHEYTHGLSNRLITDAEGHGAVGSAQAGAMGEAWSDWYAMDFMMKQGFIADTDKPGEIKVGEFVDGGQDLIRTEAIDCTLGAPREACPRKRSRLASDGGGGYTYEDFGRIVGSPQVHADGEIWSQTLMDLRRRMVADHGDSEGTNRIEYLVTRGMELSVEEPSFIDMRNAILQADLVTGGRDQRRIWEAFATRGMGHSASAESGRDTAPVAAFDLPPNLPPADMTAPAVRFDSPAEGAVVRGEAAAFAGTATDDAGVKALTLNGQPVTLSGSSWSATLKLPAGRHTLTLVGRDVESREGTATRTVISDLAAPALRVRRPRAARPRKRGSRRSRARARVTATVTGTVTDDTGVAGLTVNGRHAKVGRGGAFRARVRLSRRSRGRIRVVATDRAGRATTRTARVRAKRAKRRARTQSGRKS